MISEKQDNFSSDNRGQVKENARKVLLFVKISVATAHQ